jgi:flagellum-specific peptidoglycan hydrolase FlgJ/LysM repeat protein
MPVLRAQTMTTQQYIAAYKDIAIEEMRRSGVPAAVKLAQGILETQSGNGWLVLNSNNHFGIKCKNNWVGQTVSYDDDARNECFRKYDNAFSSYRDHSAFLQNNPRYAFLFQFSPDDYKSWAYGLKQAGYATSRTYPQQLIKIIEDNNLQQYTQEGMGLAKAKETEPEETAASEYTEEHPRQPARRTAAAAPPAPKPRPSYPKGVFQINGSRVLYLPAGTALIQVADKYDIRLSRLLKYNELKDDRPLPRDMFIYLEKKSKRGKDDFHNVSPGESLHDIAQAEGIQLTWLRRRNRLQEGQEPAPGQRLALDGYANRTPRLLAHASERIIPEDEQHKDFDPKEFVEDVKEEIAKNQEAVANQEEEATVTAGPAAPQQNKLPAGMVDDLKKVADVSKAENSAPVAAAPPPASAQAQAAPRATPPPPPPATAPAQRGIDQFHDVQPKETLFGIAKRYNTSIEQLQRWNNIQGNDIKIGQRLLVGR